jgi:outer membrane cobalamin receptor
MHPLLLAICYLASGHVHSSAGTPLPGASVTFRGPQPARATSDAKGDFALRIAAGDYQVGVSVRGYASVSLDVRLERDTALDVTLVPLDTATLRTIGTVVVNGRLTPVRGAVPSTAVTRDEMEQLGQSRVVNALQQIPSVTFSRPDGGGDTGIEVVSLRGPDPSETLIALDGQLLNDANTGDVDLSRFPVAAFSAIDVTEGLGPQDSEGSNTIGGTVNLVSLQPTQQPHYALSLTAGSFGYSEEWLNSTNTSGRFGYALALDNQHEAGYVNQTVPRYQAGTAPGCPANCPVPTHLGSTIAAQSSLANLTYTFSERAAVSVRVFALGDVRDQSATINGIDAFAGDPANGVFIGPGNQTLAQDVRAYQLRGRFPLGAGEMIAEASTDDDAIDVNGASASPYDVVHQDRRTTESVQWERTFENSEFAVGGYARYERFNFQYANGPVNEKPALGQSIRSYFVRGGWQAEKELRLDAALYESQYSTFGSNLDGRAGAIYNVGPNTDVRFSIGTGFRAPLLIERYVFPVGALTRDAGGIYLGQGNPSERPEHATEYELGASHRFSPEATLDVSLYRTNLRDPIENYYPIALAGTPACVGPANAPPNVNPRCFSYPINVGNVVYEGLEARYVQQFIARHLFLTAEYGLNVAYPFNLGSNVSNPTSGGDLVNGQQFLGIPQQQGSLRLDFTLNPWHASIAATFRGKNNELNQGPLTWIDAAAGRRVTPNLDVTIAATNIFNDGAGRYTIFGGGVPYNGVGGPLFTDRYAVMPAGVRIVLTVRG